MLTFDIPYTAEMSKNHKNFNPHTKRYYTNQHKKTAKTEIAWLMRPHRAKFSPKQPVFIVLTLFRAHTRTDPHNFVEVVADGIEDGIGIDDCHYEIYSRAAKLVDGKAPFIRVHVTPDKEAFIKFMVTE